MLKSTVLDYSPIPKNTHVPLDRRDAERAPIHYRVIYTGSDGARLIKTEGSLRDLSTTGCKILGTFLPPLGSSLTITLYFEDGHAPMYLAGATVSWIKGSIFAIRFPKLAGEQRKRVQNMILKHITLSRSTSQRTAFRIAL
ncbi:PilZ domain-containing protein [Petrachloros mirabilis]